jgi:hypothetical protein
MGLILGIDISQRFDSGDEESFYTEGSLSEDD